MQIAATRQDLQGALDNAKNRLIERLATKKEIQNMQRDIQCIVDSTRRHDNDNRIIAEVHAQSQRQQNVEAQLLQRSSQFADKLVQLESRLIKMEQELHSFREFLERS